MVYIIASARKRLLIEVNGMDKKVRERILLRLVQSYDDEHCIAKSSEDYKVFFVKKNMKYSELLTVFRSFSEFHL